MTKNRLADETSPYLLQHKDNPVHWYGWNEEALYKAQKDNKPILLSVGYAACHWCHVMAHESFEDNETARLMNENFINIKVDREERPDIDAIYQKALQIMGEHGGWPLTIFLTPDQKPFFGGTYFPPQDGFGRPGFKNLLTYISKAYQSNSEAILKDKENVFERLTNIFATRAFPAKDYPILLQAAVKTLPIMDTVNGGTNGAPKFPQTQFLDLFHEVYLKTKTQEYLDIFLTSLKRMSDGGIYDHLGGGYSRYSTDEHWFAPHFEKMLYDNALILEMLSKAWALTKDPFWQDKAQETVSWLQREMMVGKAFAAALDADSEGKEGLYYTWEESELEQELKEGASLYKTYYNTEPEGNWEGRNILHRLKSQKEFTDQELKNVRACNKKLLEIRNLRIPPERDDKILADWNGMIIAALVEASKSFNQPEWLQPAEDCFENITTEMMDKNFTLYHSYCYGKKGTQGLLDDYANMARGALKLYQATANPSYLKHAQKWMDILSQQFQSPTGGYFLTPQKGESLIVRPYSGEDSANLSPNAVAAENWTTLYYLTGQSEAKEKALALFEAFSGQVNQSLLGFMGLVLAHNGLKDMLQIICIGNPQDKEIAKVKDTLSKIALPAHCFQIIEKECTLPSNHPGYGKENHPSGTVFICKGQTCSKPIHDAKNIADEIERLLKEVNNV